MDSLIYKVNKIPVEITLGPINYRGPLPSKDSRRLLVRTEVPKSGLLKWDARSRNYLPLLSGISVRTAAFSKDGAWIAYGSFTDNNLWRCRSTGSDCRKITTSFQQVAMPQWSPDGRQIAFMGRHFGEKWTIFVVLASGDRMERLSSGAYGAGDPSWSPDGKRIVYGNVAEPPQASALHVLDMVTRKETTVLQSNGFFSPRWSPDGRFLAAVRRRDQEVTIFDCRRERWQPLSDVHGGYLNWSADSRWVYFATHNGARAVYRVDIYTHRIERVADLTRVEQGPFIFGTWVGMAPDESPIAVQNQTTENIYAWDFEAK
jgi:Tol biopolymer transport system component